jgi:hypothetical protein
VEEVSEVRARWLDHRLHAEVNVAVDPDLSVAEGHAIAREVNHRLLHHLGYLSGAVIHVDPVQEAGEEHHHIASHSHDGLPTHSHSGRPRVLPRTRTKTPLDISCNRGYSAQVCIVH